MGCDVVRFPRSGAEVDFTIVCVRSGRGGRRTPCTVGDCDREAVALCDYPVGARGRTCSRKLCDRHRRCVGDDRDFCPAHASAAPHVRHLNVAPPEQMGLGL